MANWRDWTYLLVAIAIAAAGNTISAHWASQETKFSVWLLITILVAPFVFITFGLLTSRTGLAVAAGTVDLPLTLITIAIGLVAFGEWHRVSPTQYVGMVLAVAGIALLLLSPKHGA